MNQKDYKEIAGIIYECQTAGNDTKMYLIKIDVINKLADYFEKEDDERDQEDPTSSNFFSKKQFLKGCGVND